MAETEKLDLVCPRCRTPLALDCGFAGSVCRCSQCGELLSVRGSAGRADEARRPERPPTVAALSSSTVTRPATVTGRLPGAGPRPRRRWPRWALAALVLVLIIVAAAWWVMESGSL